jgi:hypothetical protein
VLGLGEAVDIRPSFRPVCGVKLPDFAIAGLRDYDSLRIDGDFHLCRTGHARVDRLQDPDGDLCGRPVPRRFSSKTQYPSIADVAAASRE